MPTNQFTKQCQTNRNGERNELKDKLYREVLKDIKNSQQPK
jgi:hypothetical protein